MGEGTVLTMSNVIVLVNLAQWRGYRYTRRVYGWLPLLQCESGCQIIEFIMLINLAGNEIVVF